MGKFLHDDVLEQGPKLIKDNANLMILCSQQPTTRTEAVTTYALADQAMVTGDFTFADGDTSGRKLTVAAKSAIDVDVTGSGDHVALVDGTRLLAVTTCPSVSVDSSGTVDIATFDVECSDPS